MPTYPKRNTAIEEQETTVNFFRDEKTASIYTSDRTTITKLDNLCDAHPVECKVIRMDEYSKWYIIPKSYVKFLATRRTSESQREARRQNARKSFSARTTYEENDPNSPR